MPGILFWEVSYQQVSALYAFLDWVATVRSALACLYAFNGVLVRLFAQLVSGQMISLAMGRGGGSMSVSCQVVKFCDSIMRALWHGILLLNRMY
jgi:hypothetical protein